MLYANLAANFLFLREFIWERKKKDKTKNSDDQSKITHYSLLKPTSGL